MPCLPHNIERRQNYRQSTRFPTCTHVGYDSTGFRWYLRKHGAIKGAYEAFGNGELGGLYLISRSGGLAAMGTILGGTR